MKVKCGIIYNALQTIMEIAEKPMKVSLAAKFLRLSDDLQRESNYIDKQRRDIILKYAEKDENNNPIVENDNVKIEEGKYQEAQNELNELSNFEVDISDRMITEEDLEASDLQLTISQLGKIREFFHKEKETEIIED